MLYAGMCSVRFGYTGGASGTRAFGGDGCRCVFRFCDGIFADKTRHTVDSGRNYCQHRTLHDQYCGDGIRLNLNLFACDSVFTWAKDAIGGTWYKLIVAAVIVALVGVLISLFLNTRLGLSIRATGDNPDMVRASSINTGMMITIGLCVANALTGLSGGLLAQYQKSCDINLGTGMVTIALASLIIGETIIGNGSMLKRVIGVILGSCLYRFIVAVALRLNVPAECLKLVSSIIVAVAIAFPYLKKQAVFYRQKRAAKAENEQYIAELLREERKGKGGNA